MDEVEKNKYRNLTYSLYQVISDLNVAYSMGNNLIDKINNGIKINNKAYDNEGIKKTITSISNSKSQLNTLLRNINYKISS